MSGYFFDPLKAELIGERNRRPVWRLLRGLAYKSEILDEILWIKAGFETDFASVPRLPLAWLLAGDTAHKAAVVHDFLVAVRLPAGKIAWSRAADVFDEALRAERVPGWRRVLMVAAVRLAGLARVG